MSDNGNMQEIKFIQYLVNTRSIHLQAADIKTLFASASLMWLAFVCMEDLVNIVLGNLYTQYILVKW